MGLWTRENAGQDTTGVSHTAIRAFSTSPCATPSGWPRPARSHPPGRQATATTTPGRGVQLAVQGRAGPQQGPVERHRRPRDRRRRVHRLVQPPTPARRDRPRSTGRARGRLLPAPHRGDYRRRVTSEPPLNPARDRQPKLPNTSTQTHTFDLAINRLHPRRTLLIASHRTAPQAGRKEPTSSFPTHPAVAEAKQGLTRSCRSSPVLFPETPGRFGLKRPWCARGELNPHVLSDTRT
jgi:hypothetical protein